MKKFLLVLFMVFFALAGSFAEAEIGGMKLFKVTPVADNYLLSYSLEDKDGEFWIAVEDTLKSGKAVKISHYITVENTDILFNDVVKHSMNYSLSYSLLENTYKYNNGGSVTHVTKDKNQIKNYILTVKNLALINKELLQRDSLIKTGEEYYITIKATVEEYKEGTSWVGFGWLKPLLPQNWFKQTLKAKEIYIAQ